ncbi:hypothetical protein [Myroides pelagicus]|uniref:Nuclear transport factor 2 family protein n=1 Tax=Myroides pelagicus TaxID=270914 RepID=A0A7K1GPX2_9FLAO|nr:hypothetical protein [Myroides pelagicus]MEC4115201.1 hypothetical protein [Myroides pelagicus]MTH30780.1 hypothetical protein [Myroides pelagicus]
MVITPLENIEDPQFEPAYLDNRVKSFLHYWLYLLETIKDQDNNLKFKELVHHDFSISKDSSNTANKMDALQSWINTIIPEKGEYTLCFENLTIQEKQDLSIEISFDLKRNDTCDNQSNLTITKQIWLLKNNTDHRFAQLKAVL